tara:strand:+ start:629 stop:1123 length:495 start_codon:yes stop_codon:yes gene_type:complete
MQRLLLAAACLFLLFSCKKEKKRTALEDNSSFEIATDGWPQKIPLNDKSQTFVNEWQEFRDMDTSFDALYTVDNREDLTLVIEDMIEKQKVLAESIYPGVFDRAQIKGRQKVFKTFVLKVKGDLIYRLDPQASVLELIKAYNDLRNQFNIMTGITLDTNLILNE